MTILLGRSFWCIAVVAMLLIPSVLARIANSQTVLHVTFLAFLK